MQRTLALLAVVSACSAHPATAPTAELRLHASELLPADLDFVVRVDAERFTGTGIEPGALIDLTKGAAPGALHDARALLRGARAIDFGGRVMSDGLHGDGVVVVERRPDTENRPDPGPEYRSIPAPPWVRAYERRGPVERSETALEVIVADGVVLATLAEVDAVLRVAAGGPDPGRLEPPLRGVVSIAGRVATGTTRASWPALLREVGDGLLRYEGSVSPADAPSSDLLIEAELIYASSAAAEASSIHLKGAAAAVARAAARWQSIAQSLEVVQAGSGLRLRINVPFALLGHVH